MQLICEFLIQMDISGFLIKFCSLLEGVFKEDHATDIFKVQKQKNSCSVEGYNGTFSHDTP